MLARPFWTYCWQLHRQAFDGKITRYLNIVIDNQQHHERNALVVKKSNSIGHGTDSVPKPKPKSRVSRYYKFSGGIVTTADTATVNFQTVTADLQVEEEPNHLNPDLSIITFHWR